MLSAILEVIWEMPDQRRRLGKAIRRILAKTFFFADFIVMLVVMLTAEE